MNSIFKVLLFTLILIVFNPLAISADPLLDVDFSNETEDKGSSPFPVFLKSAVLPGWGELSMENKSGYLFLGLEVLLWCSRYYFREEVRLREEESYIYALQNAGLNPGKYDRDFLYLLTRYNSSGFEPGGYNEMVLQRAKALSDDPVEQQQYIQENAIFDENLFWSWESREHRRLYSIMRKNADHNRDYVKAVVGILIANRITSAINSVRIHSLRRHQERIKLSVDFDKTMRTPLLHAEFQF